MVLKKIPVVFLRDLIKILTNKNEVASFEYFLLLSISLETVFIEIILADIFIWSYRKLTFMVSILNGSVVVVWWYVLLFQ